ncbi:hypothetical protein SEPCBS57363_006453 [Sporothrix epigloea]|uniref:Uncharacterized protein n=1 Tax=Sporothrix epigloea TaxID=1892477 RepID=A0ABP0E345_9PEZI
MAPSKSKKRASSNDSIEDSGLEDFAEDDKSLFRPGQNKKNRGNGWSSWQEGVRNQEADRAKRYVTTFQKDVVAAARDKAIATLGRGEEAKDKKNIDSIREVYDTASAGAVTSVTDHQLYAAGREVLALFHATIARYEQANVALGQIFQEEAEANGKTMKDVLASWQKDRGEANKLLHYGRLYGDSLVRGIIVPKTAAGGSAGSGEGGGRRDKLLVDADAGGLPESGLNKTGRTALGMFPKSRATVARGQTWGEAAKSQVQALKGLLKTLPSIGSHRNGEPMTTKSVTFGC